LKTGYPDRRDAVEAAGGADDRRGDGERVSIGTTLNGDEPGLESFQKLPHAACDLAGGAAGGVQNQGQFKRGSFALTPEVEGEGQPSDGCGRMRTRTSMCC
jgi:hypothetical protein